MYSGTTVPSDDISPWILVREHKDGANSRHCYVANNIVSSAVSYEGSDVIASNNYVFGKENYDSIYVMFSDPERNDFTLLDNEFTREKVIDQGIPFDELVSSGIDISLTNRGKIPDLGAYELK